MIRLMNRKECLSAYQNEVWKQENPYQQWILQNEGKNTDVYGEVPDNSLRIMKMEECTSSFDLVTVPEKYLLFVSGKGEMSSFAPLAIYDYFEKHNDVNMIYADEDEYDVKTKQRTNPWFKPDYAPDSLLSSFYFGHIFAIRVDKFREIPLLCGQDYRINLYDFVLKAVEIPGGVYHLPKILFHCNEQQTDKTVMYASEEFDEIKLETCKRRKMQAILAEKENTGLNIPESAGKDSNDRKNQQIRHICYAIENEPLVSVIIPSKDHFETLQSCITSFLKFTKYPHVEFIVVDNGSCEEQKEKILQFLKDTFDNDINYNCYYDYEEQPFNFSKMCNRGAERAVGEYLLFLNDDIEIISEEWLDRMLGQAMLPHIGAVGCKLLYPQDRKIQHVGITNMGMGPAHKLNGFVDNQVYAHGENCLVLNKIAVTAACLLVSREKFKKAGGFPSDMAVAYNDVALCFSLLKHGYLNVVRNDVTLIHHESLSRGMDDTNEKKKRLLREKKLLYSRYPKWDGRDPYYSKDWVQLRKDTDYTCNYLYDFEDEKQQNKITRVMQGQKKNITKARSNNKLVRKLLKQDALCFSIETIQGKTPILQDGKNVFFYRDFDKEETDFLQINGWAVIRKDNNACYEYKMLLRNEEDVIYESRTFSALRHDVEQVFSETGASNLALAGKVARFSNETITPGIYQIGIAAKSLISGKYSYVTWSGDYLLFFLKK